MIAWIVGAWATPLGRKFIIYGAVGLVIFLCIGYGVYRYGTRVWDDSQKQEYLRGRKEVDDQFKSREAGLLKDLAAEKLKNEKGQAAYESNLKLLAAREEELLRARRALDLAAARIEAKAVASIEAGHVAAANLDAADAADTITKFAVELAADKDWRKRIPAGRPNP